MATAASKPEASPARAMVTVARGRSIAFQVQVGTRLVDGKAAPIFEWRTAGPREEVEVDAHEVGLLRERGFVVDPDGAPSLQILIARNYTIRREIQAGSDCNEPAGVTPGKTELSSSKLHAMFLLWDHAATAARFK
jgi:hypothetical protein